MGQVRDGWGRARREGGRGIVCVDINLADHAHFDEGGEKPLA